MYNHVLPTAQRLETHIFSVLFLQRRPTSLWAGSQLGAYPAMSAQGLALAGFSACGSAACEFARKKLTGAGMDPSTIISLVCLIEGIVGLSGLTVANSELPMPPVSFWFPALASAGLSAMTATLLTKAYSENDISLCAPFNAALPVFRA